jgi:hypothetical protein
MVEIVHTAIDVFEISGRLGIKVYGTVSDAAEESTLN